MFDLDRFKAVNDRHGHAAGDAVIRKFCEIITAALRPNDVFGRMGGEEFAVVLPGSSIEFAYVRAERMRASFAASCRFAGNRQVDATVSCGLSVSCMRSRHLPRCSKTLIPRSIAPNPRGVTVSSAPTNPSLKGGCRP